MPLAAAPAAEYIAMLSAWSAPSRAAVEALLKRDSRAFRREVSSAQEGVGTAMLLRASKGAARAASRCVQGLGRLGPAGLAAASGRLWTACVSPPPHAPCRVLP